MVLAGSILTLVGLTIIYFRVPFLGFTLLPPDMSALITVLWVVGMANAVNLIDGLDGLAAGIVAIGAGSFFLYGWRLLEVGVIDPGNLGPLGQKCGGASLCLRAGETLDIRLFKKHNKSRIPKK